jgi:hypothetical protein
MDIVYLDYNCFQRGFDDPRQTRIQMEALACREIFERAERNQVRLVWSFMHEDETFLCPFPERKYEVLRLSDLCKIRIGPLEEKRRGSPGVRLSTRCWCFLTCDDRLVRRVNQMNLEIKAMNPVDYVRQEVE